MQMLLSPTTSPILASFITWVWSLKKVKYNVIPPKKVLKTIYNKSLGHTICYKENIGYYLLLAAPLNCQQDRLQRKGIRSPIKTAIPINPCGLTDITPLVLIFLLWLKTIHYCDLNPNPNLAQIMQQNMVAKLIIKHCMLFVFLWKFLTI